MARPRKNPGTETNITGTGEITSTDQPTAQRATRGRKPRSVKGASGRGTITDQSQTENSILMRYHLREAARLSALTR